MKKYDAFPGLIIRGGLLGVVGACIGTLVFVSIVALDKVIRFGPDSNLLVITLAFFIGCILSCMPAGLGGGLLGWIVYKWNTRIKISKRGGFLIGALVGWLAGIISYAALLVLINFRGKLEVFFWQACIVTIIALLIGGWVGRVLVITIRIDQPEF